LPRELLDSSPHLLLQSGVPRPLQWRHELSQLLLFLVEQIRSLAL
jgi:hypothetical protein